INLEVACIRRTDLNIGDRRCAGRLDLKRCKSRNRCNSRADELNPSEVEAGDRDMRLDADAGKDVLSGIIVSRDQTNLDRVCALILRREDHLLRAWRRTDTDLIAR